MDRHYFWSINLWLVIAGPPSVKYQTTVTKCKFILGPKPRYSYISVWNRSVQTAEFNLDTFLESLIARQNRYRLFYGDYWRYFGNVECFGAICTCTDILGKLWVRAWSSVRRFTLQMTAILEMRNVLVQFGKNLCGNYQCAPGHLFADLRQKWQNRCWSSQKDFLRITKDFASYPKTINTASSNSAK